MAAAAAPVTMDAYLQVTLNITNNGLREKIIEEGYESLEKLVRKDKNWVRSLRLSIKKGTGNTASRAITLRHEAGLVKTMLWAKLRYLTQRPLTYVDATVDSITEVYDWYNEQECWARTSKTLGSEFTRELWLL
jgi:hypothetical protein